MVLRIRNRKMQPSHSHLGWDTVITMASIEETQQQWSPPLPTFCVDIAPVVSSSPLSNRRKYVEEENEISKYPGVELVLIDGLMSLETHNGEMQKKWRVYHQFKVFETNTSGQHYSVDFSLAIVEISVSSSDMPSLRNLKTWRPKVVESKEHY